MSFLVDCFGNFWWWGLLTVFLIGFFCFLGFSTYSVRFEGLCVLLAAGCDVLYEANNLKM